MPPSGYTVLSQLMYTSPSVMVREVSPWRLDEFDYRGREGRCRGCSTERGVR
jgi:hypothetical protein